MSPLCNELVTILIEIQPEQSFEFESTTVNLYSGAIGEKMLNQGYLNIAIRVRDESVFGLRIDEIKKLSIIIEYQPKAKTLDTSFVVGIQVKQEKLYAQHWNGYHSVIDLKNRVFLSQRFTK